MSEHYGFNVWNEGVVKEFAKYSIIFVPTSIIFTIESFWTLKAWKAVQKLPPTQIFLKNDSPPKKKWGFRVFMPDIGGIAVVLYMTAIMVWGFKMQLSESPEPFNTNYFYLITLTPPLVFFIGRMISMYIGFIGCIVSRAPSGHVLKRVKNTEGYDAVLCYVPYVLAIIPVINCFLLESRVLMAINIAAITRFLVSSGTPSLVVGKHMVINTTVMFVYLCMMISTHSITKQALTLDIFPEPKDGTVGWPYFILASFACSWSYGVIAACLRFDHFNAASPISLPLSQEGNSESFDATTGILSNTGLKEVAVQRPTIKEIMVPKPYFCAALAGWLASFLILAFVAVETKSHIGPLTSGFFVAYLSPAMMSVFIGITSVSRKETKKLWMYREDWFIKPQVVAEEGANALKEEKIVEFVDEKIMV